MIERCGVVKGGKFIEYENIAVDKTNTFELPEIALNDDIEAIWHTHTNGLRYLSSTDRLNQLVMDKTWILRRDDSDLIVKPIPLLVGREFEYGKSDCGTIIEDAFHLMGINLDLTVRGDMLDDMKSGYITDSLERVGFYRVNDIQEGDVLVTTYNNSADHMMLYLGNEEVIHHLYNRLSRVDFLHGFYRKKISYIFRHKDYKDGMIQAVLNDIEASNG